MRQEAPLDLPSTTWAHVGGRTLLNLCSNNYLGIGNDSASLPRHLSASTASRLVCGTTAAHLAAEDALAKFVQAEAAVLFSSGYAANVGVISALATKEDVIFSDALNHASIIDGCRLARSQTRIYRHLDLEDLSTQLAARRNTAEHAYIVSETLFSMDGDSPDLIGLARLAAKHNAFLILDEAHALGVYGPSGAGLCAQRSILPDVLIGTLGKAFGLPGAFAACTRPVAELIRNRARSYIFSTAPAPSIAEAISEMIPRVASANQRRSQLEQNAARLRAGLTNLGFKIPEGTSPIIPVLLGDPTYALEVSLALREQRVLAQAIRPPTVPEGTARLRLVPMATHTQQDIDFAVAAFSAIRGLNR